MITQKNINTFIALALSAILVTACASPGEIAAADRGKCAGYGFAEGSDAFANCMMEADMHRKDQQAAFQRQQQMNWAMERENRSSDSMKWSEGTCRSSGGSISLWGITGGSSSSTCSTGH
ncbi:hypothetical protein [Collimonas sp. PA-H2]|uniref:hypothetical protein n=1 Tax=Collimonas sp. PA-H2 TaxID=1881062 RepID=UPI00117D2DB2|nr:hypothetical protein [Collimonas sp. PA-H2]